MKIFGFDFSIIKPAMFYYDTETKQSEFYCWPASEDKKSIEILNNAGIVVRNRNLPPLSKNDYDSNSLVFENTKRAAELSELITEDIMNIVGDEPLDNIYICSEGLAFASNGNQTLDLSGYKAALLTTLYKRGVRNIFTYSPITIKSVAGCSKKGMWTKDFMINAIKKTNPSLHTFVRTLSENEKSLKKVTAFVPCVDDLVDAYWVVRTFMERHLKMSLLS